MYAQIASQFAELSRRLPVDLMDAVQQMIQLDAERRPTAQLLTRVRCDDGYRWFGGVMIRTLKLRLRGRGFDSRFGCYHVLTIWMGHS